MPTSTSEVSLWYARYAASVRGAVVRLTGDADADDALHDAHLVPAGQQLRDQQAANVASAAGDKNTHAPTPLPRIPSSDGKGPKPTGKVADAKMREDVNGSVGRSR